MNKTTDKTQRRRGFCLPDWLTEDWVWQGLLFVLVAPAVVTSILSIGSGVSV